MNAATPSSPDHWKEKTLGDALEVVRGISFPSDDKKKSPQQDHIACLRTANVQEKVDWEDLWYVPEEHVSRDEQYVQPLDILISTANSYELVGKVSLVRELPHSATLGAFISLIRVPEGLDSRFFYHQLNSFQVQNAIKQYASTTTNISNVSSKKLKQVTLKVPPLPEQRRIVAKIEELFSDLDAGVADLKRAKKQLQRYRKSVLQSAVEGRLTKAWREERDTEPADKLLERILEERRAQWEKDYRAKYEAKGKEPPSGWKSRYKPAEELDTSDLPELPEGWVWTSMDQLLSNVRNGYSKAPKAESGVPILRISAVRPLSVDLSDVRYLEGKPEDYEKYLIEPGYLLFVRYNGNPELVGVCGTVKELDQEYAHPDKLIRGEVAEPEVAMPRFLEMAFNVGKSRDHIANRVRTTAGQAGISQGDIYSAPVPVPPPEEQRQIVNEVERLLSVADEAMQTVEREIKRAERLRQSILKQAFSGQLVEHDGRFALGNEVSEPAVSAEGAQIEMPL